MVNWPLIRLLETRLAFHLGKFHWWRGHWTGRKKAGDTAHEWERKHLAEGRKDLARVNQQQIIAIRDELQKLGAKMDAELREVVKYRTAIAKLKPKPPPASNEEERLAHDHPELHLNVRKVTAVILTHWPNLVITSTTGGHHVPGSLHYIGCAVDLASTQDYMDKAALWIKETLTPRLTEGIHNPNLAVKYGHPVYGPSFYAAVWEGHRNHIHIGVV